MDRNEVHIAFEILLEEIEGVANRLNDEGADAFRSGNYEAAQRVIEAATRLAEFREKVKALQKEWDRVFAGMVRPSKRRGRRKKPLPRGLRTPEDAFRRLILEVLVELGGRAPMSEVLDRVEKKMEGRLTPHDYKPLPSDPKTIRWRNTAQWCRNTLVREGLMKGDSPRGVWEISEEGRGALQTGAV
ncbi:hypothetical protein HRbin08_01307 [bacterium HR08]|nr:hypothetical protein HRbin08_01307 [bacterium HR08]